MLGKHSKLFFAVSVVFLIVSIILAAWGFPKIVSRQVQKNIQLDNSSMMYEKWLKLPMPLDFKIYVFNVTNTDDVNNGEKPILSEIGPYVYKQYRERTVLGYGANDTIKYMLKKTFVFDADESAGLTENDEVIVIHFSYMAAILTVHDMMPSAVGMINKALEQFFSNLTDPFLRVKVKDLFFDGIFLNCDGEGALVLVCSTIKANAPATMRPAEDGVNGFYFSMFSHMNRTESGPYEMVRGTKDVYDLGHIVSYKDKPSVSTWEDDYCGMLNGSDSTIFPPIDETNVPDRMYTFEPEICRSLYVNLAGKKNLFNISSYYYEISESALAAKSANPNNKCFCKKPINIILFLRDKVASGEFYKRIITWCRSFGDGYSYLLWIPTLSTKLYRNWSANHDGCLIMGLLNLMRCQGAPAISSLPHFYLASEELLEYFQEGISPDKEKHNTYVYIDPVTGVVLKGVKRLQFNIELRKMPTVPQLQDVPTGLFPLLWVEEGAEIPESIQQEIRDSHVLLTYVEAARWILLAVGIVATIVAAVAVARSASLISWPRNSNSVSFILGSSVNADNKVR